MVQASFYIRINRIYKYLLFYKRTKENLFMKKNKKFQKEQMTAEGYTEFVEFFNK